jgi:regulator of Ty1 transposition protein 103
LCKTTSARKLTFLYLANNVVLNNKKTHPELFKEFASVLKSVLEYMSSVELDKKTEKGVGKLIGIWRTRLTFDSEMQRCLEWTWDTRQPSTSGDHHERSPEKANKRKEDAADPRGPKKRVRVVPKPDSPRPTTGAHSVHLKRASSLSSDSAEASSSAADVSSSAAAADVDELVKAMERLEHSASSDWDVRARISRLPPDGYSAEAKRVTSSTDAKALLGQVGGALAMVKEYNGRLQEELNDRKRVGRMVKTTLSEQKRLLAEDEKELAFYKNELAKMNAMSRELKSHVVSLPDRSQLPYDPSGELAPLPPAQYLFDEY